MSETKIISRKISVLPDPAALAQEAALRVIAAADEAIARQGSFSIAMSGGSTPKALYTLLASEPLKSRVQWDKWEVFWGDERCVPPTDKESNYKMALEAMLSKVPIPPEKIHRMKGEIDPNVAATEYGQLLKQKYGDQGLDLVLLGMGPDGHTLSLFPGTTALKEQEHRVVSNWVEKFKTFRVTFSAPFTNKARRVMVMLAGADKREKVKQVLEGPYQPEVLPIQLIDPASQGGELVWLMDAAAAEMA